ncbi:helix-turn-helix domain-containing protein [Azospirillum formosense]|nr:helix-turn-helix domain-containing protein [Azospirillum formosense]
MKPIRYIRKTVLGVSQGEFARIAGSTQTTVSRWERGELEPSRSEMARIRDYAKASGKPWDDSWFFDPPAIAAVETAAA